MGLDFLLAVGQRHAATEAVDQWRGEDQRIEDLLKRGYTAWCVTQLVSFVDRFVVWQSDREYLCSLNLQEDRLHLNKWVAQNRETVFARDNSRKKVRNIPHTAAGMSCELRRCDKWSRQRTWCQNSSRVGTWTRRRRTKILQWNKHFIIQSISDNVISATSERVWCDLLWIRFAMTWLLWGYVLCGPD